MGVDGTVMDGIGEFGRQLVVLTMTAYQRRVVVGNEWLVGEQLAGWLVVEAPYFPYAHHSTTAPPQHQRRQ
jgi:hypothetical protein